MGHNDRDTLIVIDGSNLVYRAFHAIPATLVNSSGLHTNAVYGFTQTFRKILDDYAPRYVAVAFDVRGETFRHAMHEGYKAERPSMPDLLSEQMPYIKRVVRAFNIPVLEKESFEADDIMATVVARMRELREAGEADVRVVLVTGDKDMYQLVDDDTVILDHARGVEYTAEAVEEKFGVPPASILDLLALAGDASDNIPGVPGIGMKTGAKLLRMFGSIDGVYARLGEVGGKRLRENLEEFRDRAMLSRELATLRSDVPLDYALCDMEYAGPDLSAMGPLLMELEFRKMLAGMRERYGKAGTGGDEDRRERVELKRLEDVSRLAEEIRSTGRVAVALSMTGEGYSATLDAAAFATGAGKAHYVRTADGTADGLAPSALCAALKDLLEDEAVRKDTDDSKRLYLCFPALGAAVQGVGMDTSLASYLLDPSRQDHTVETLTYEQTGSLPGVPDSGASEGEAEADSLCERACNISMLSEILEKKLKDEGLYELYSAIELPLSRVLAEMEMRGIRVDLDALTGLSREMEAELADLERGIYEAAGTEFNINSPRQLSEVLFARLGLKPVKKTKTGFSTDEEVLTKLASEHEMPARIISYRQTAKLKSTYVDAIAALADPATSRVHTSFNQTVTATGRLSSSRPNMQNIPVRGETASRIRRAFVAGPGTVFLSADYSQIELRLVAHMSGDPVLVDSFRKGQDVHARTAGEVFGIMPGLVTPELRRRAKAINFGIIYGMGPYGLSNELGIPLKEATEYIESYFEHYASVKEFIDRTVERAVERGYTETLMGRRRFVPELRSPVESTRRLGARIAVNTPVQGTAADMIKGAMVRVDGRMAGMDLDPRTGMLLQIHDELLLEVAAGDLERVSAMVKDEMEGVLGLKVPVVVNLKTGKDWESVE